MRVSFQKESNVIIDGLRKRCPDVKIEIIAGINRINDWPGRGKMHRLRRALKGKVAFHCRGEMFFEWPYMVKKKSPGDAIVLDVRGFFPLERFINDHHILTTDDMTNAQKAMYFKDLGRLQHAVDNSEVVATVSEPLRQYLIEHVKAGQDTTVVPCCVKNTVADTRREKIRQLLDVENRTAILYLGGVHPNQYLEELGIPFMQSALTQSNNNVAVFITQNKDRLMPLLTKFALDMDRVRVLSVPQNEVADYLTGMDLGLLLRAPSKQNNFSQPVKFGEYLSAGVPVVLEEGTGNMADMLNQYGIGKVVRLWERPKHEFDAEVKKTLDWLKENSSTVRNNTRMFVEECYTWQANVPKERAMYIRALEKASKK